nr:probable LRR receptor-like serine/threonine-protein kinase At3g47570 [Malus domestica]
MTYPTECSPGCLTTPVKSKHKTYQYVLWVLSLILLIVGYTLFRAVNLNNYCSWCHYLSSVPTSKWNCKSQNIYCLALVYEYMEKGSLETWLHPPTDIEEAREAPKSLNLLQRLSISIDVACFILVDYLHNHSETPIVHCDLKPSTVLLDNMSTGHV